MTDTPRTDSLLVDPLDSNDVRAWVSLCRELEAELGKVRSDYQQHVAMVASKQRPAYDEQQQMLNSALETVRLRTMRLDELERRIAALQDALNNNSVDKPGVLNGPGSGTWAVFAEQQYAKAERYRADLQTIKQWCDAYPVDVFPEPDMELARQGLAEVGITLDAVSASNMRHVLKGVGEIIGATMAAEDKS